MYPADVASAYPQSRGRGPIVGCTRAMLRALGDNFFAYWDTDSGPWLYGGVRNVEDATGSGNVAGQKA